MLRFGWFLGRGVGRRGFSSLIVDSAYGSMEYPKMPISDFVWENVDKWADNTALVCGLTGHSYTYGEARKMAKNFGSALIESGFCPGQVISIVLPNIPEYPIALLGALEAGLIVSTINPIYNAEEISYQLNDSRSKCVVTFPEKVSVVGAAAETTAGGGLPIVVVGGTMGGRPFSSMTGPRTSASPPMPSIDPNSIALLPYSSGTTGLPKGVKLSHFNIVANNTQISHPNVRFCYDSTKDYQDVIPCVLPFFHIYGLSIGMLSYMRLGAKLITLPRFEPESYLKVLKEEKCSILHVVPPLVQFMASHPAVQGVHLDSIRAIINGAAAINLTDAEKLLSKKKTTIISGYGLTESSPVITSPINDCTNLLTVGSPLSDTQVKIVSIETGETIDSSLHGEVCCKGPQVMIGYHNNDVATSETLQDGWLHTGDVGYFDENKQMYIVDRIKELIKVKGFQVAPLELEELLRTHPSIADAGVVGKLDEKRGEVPVAFVVIKPGIKQPSANEIKDYVASKVAEYKQLGSVIFMASIPKNSTGKILRKELKESLKK